MTSLKDAFGFPVVTAIGSGKGGTGKTLIAVSLAQALAHTGERVLLCDGDLGLANAALHLDLSHSGDMAAVLSGRMSVEHTAVAFIPRNGSLNDIHVDVRPWDEDRAEAALRRYEALHAAVAAGPAVLPLLGSANDCRFCGWWSPGAEDLTVGCPGHNPTDVHGIPPWQPEKQESASA